MSLINWVDFPFFTDRRGSLVAIESNINIPFEIKRIYYIYATKENEARGFHAHKSLRQVAVCVAGHCTMVLDNGEEQVSVKLDTPTRGILIEKMIWREMRDFSENCVLLVLADGIYDNADYIRDRQDFLRKQHGCVKFKNNKIASC